MTKNYYYAQISDQNICIGISQLSGKCGAKNMIELKEYDTNLLGNPMKKELV